MPAPRLRVAVPIWRDPWMVVGSGTYTDDLLTRAGLVNVLAGQRRSLPDRHPGRDRREPAPTWCSCPTSPTSSPPTTAPRPSRTPTRLVSGRLLTWYGPAMVEAHALLAGLSRVASGPMTRDPIVEAHRQWVAHGWADAADGMAMVTSVVRAQQLLLERIDGVLRPRELTFARYEVLRLLSFARGVRDADVAARVAAAGAPDQRHQRRRPAGGARATSSACAATADKRVVRAVLTDAGREAVEAATDGPQRPRSSRRPGCPRTTYAS